MTTIFQVIRNMSNILFAKKYQYIWPAIQHLVIRKKILFNVKYKMNTT